MRRELLASISTLSAPVFAAFAKRRVEDVGLGGKTIATGA